MTSDTESLARYREKWREAPRGSDTDGRVFSSDLLAMSDERLLAAWNDMAARRYGGEIGWLGPLYFDREEQTPGALICFLGCFPQLFAFATTTVAWVANAGSTTAGLVLGGRNLASGQAAALAFGS